MESGDLVKRLYLIRAVLCAVLIITMFSSLDAKTIYVKTAANGGSDANTGLSWAQAFATVNAVNNNTAKGDTVYFATGTWYGYPILPPTGTGTAMTVYSCSLHTVANKFKPKIRSGDLITGWTQYSGNVYQATWNSEANGSGYSDGGNTKASQTLVQVEVDEMLVSVLSVANINQVGEFYYNSSTNTIYAWAWGGGDPDQYTLYGSAKPVVWFLGDKRNIEFFGLDLQGGKQGVVLWNSNYISDNIQFKYCHVAKCGHIASENPAAFFSQAGSYTVLKYDSTLIQSCSLGYAITENSDGWSGATQHGGAVDFYCQSNVVIESSYVYGYSANGICFKVTCDNGIIRYNIIEGTDAVKGLNMYRNDSDIEIYGNLFIGHFEEVAVELAGKKPAGEFGGLSNVKFYNNTIVNCGGVGLMMGNFEDPEEPSLFTGVCEIKYNVFWGFTRTGCTNDYNCMTIGYNRGSGGITGDWVIDSNAYWSSTSFTGTCLGTGNADLNWANWKSRCSEDPYSHNYNFQLNPTTYELPDTTSLTMNRNDYGGRTWTVYGAVQEAPTTETPKYIPRFRKW